MTQSTWTPGVRPWSSSDAGQPGPRLRVIIDNDFSGDPDDLYQVAHHVLAPSVEVRAIIAEAMQSDVDARLFLVCGGGLTDLAGVYLFEPAIAEHLTVVWIGGPEYPQLATEPPDVTNPERNHAIDVTAGRAVFNDSSLDLWQVPRNTDRQRLVSEDESHLRLATQGVQGWVRHDAISAVASLVRRPGPCVRRSTCWWARRLSPSRRSPRPLSRTRRLVTTSSCLRHYSTSVDR